MLIPCLMHTIKSTRTCGRNLVLIDIDYFPRGEALSLRGRQAA